MSDSRHNGLLTHRAPPDLPPAPPRYTYTPTADGYEIQQAQPGIDRSIANWAADQPIDAAVLASSPLPVVGDVAGFANDIRHYWANPEERRWQNYALTGVGLLPMVPPAMPISRAAGRAGAARQDAERGQEAATYEPDAEKRDMLAQLLRGNS